jgi:hypothetical protein
MAESSPHLQNQLNSFQDYCSVWKLKVNTDKSKAMFFSIIYDGVDDFK